MEASTWSSSCCTETTKTTLSINNKIYKTVWERQHVLTNRVDPELPCRFHGNSPIDEGLLSLLVDDHRVWDRKIPVLLVADRNKSPALPREVYGRRAGQGSVLGGGLGGMLGGVQGEDALGEDALGEDVRRWFRPGSLVLFVFT